MSKPHERLSEAMRLRGLELGKRWVHIADKAGITTSALGGIRRGEYRPSDHTALAIERVLEWEAGSVAAILAGGDPTPLARSTEGEGAADLGQSSGSTPSNVAASGLIDPSTQQNIDATNRDLEEIQARVKNMTPAQARALVQLLREARMGTEPDSKSDRAS